MDDECEHVSLQKLRNVAMGTVPHDTLNETEKYAYELYIAGFNDGREASILEALSRVDPDRSDELTARFIGTALQDPEIEVVNLGEDDV